MDKFDSPNDVKEISIRIKRRFGKSVPLEEHPQMIQAKINGELAKKIADSINANCNITKLYKDYINQVPETHIIQSMVEKITLSLLFSDIITIREKGAKSDRISKVQRQLQAITKPLEQAKAKLELLDRDTKSVLDAATNIRGIDLDAIDKMIEANESVIRWNKSPTQYYRPIFEALLTFQYCLSDIEHSNPIGLRLSPFRKILKKDWELFTKLMPHICFDIFNTSKRLPERLKDTVGGFKPTFDKIKELEVKYFSSDFPD